MRRFSVLLGLFTLLASGCLLSMGCLVDASKLAGYSNPKVKFNKTWSGLEVEVGTDFTGKAEGTYSPDTREIVFKVEVASSAATVVTAEGERADHLVELRKAEMAYLVESQRIVGDNMKAAGQMLALAAVGGGEAVAKMASAVAPVLAGSTVRLPGDIGGTLGTPNRPNP